MIGELLRPEFEELIARKDWTGLCGAVEELDPPDVAELIEDLPGEIDGMIFRSLPRDRAAAVFSYLTLEHQEDLIESLSNEQSNAILAEMTPDDRARMLHELPAEVTRRLLLSLAPAN